jgi:hypothetical protein
MAPSGASRSPTRAPTQQEMKMGRGMFFLTFVMRSPYIIRQKKVLLIQQRP